MKLIEKLAEELNPYDPIHDYEENGAWPDGFEAGFRAAREIIAKEIDAQSLWPYGRDLGKVLAISKIGEEEVE